MKVYKLAKELKVTSPRIIRMARALGAEARNTVTVLEPEIVQAIRQKFANVGSPITNRPSQPRTGNNPSPTKRMPIQKPETKVPRTVRQPGSLKPGAVPPTSRMPSEKIQGEVPPTARMPGTHQAKGPKPTARMSDPKPAQRNTPWSGEFPDVSDRYKIRGTIPAKGGEAMIFRGADLEDKKINVIIKVYEPEIKPKTGVMESLLGANHPDIINLLEYGDSPHGFYEVMENAEGGSLRTHLGEMGAGKGFTEENLQKNVVPEIINGLAFLHDKGIIHRDIKPANIMYRDAGRTDIVLADFGLSSKATGSQIMLRSAQRGGTFEFLAPEAWTSWQENDQLVYRLTKEMDYYALGVTLLMLLDANPFVTFDEQGAPCRMSEFELMTLHLSRPIPLPGDLSENFTRLLRGLLHKQPEKRWGHEQVVAWGQGKHVDLAEETYVSLDRPLNYKIADEVIRDPGELGPALLRHPEDAMADIGRDDMAEILRPVDTNLMRMVRRVGDLPVSIEARLVEIAHRLTPGMPFQLTPTEAVASPRELAALIDKNKGNWNAGLKKLASGEIQGWLRSGGGEAIVADWESEAQAFAGDSTQDAALEAFLHLLDPKLPQPKIKIHPERLHEHRLPGGQTEEFTAKISCSNRGHIFGTFALEDEVEGLTVPDQEIAANHATDQSTEISFQVDTNKMKRGKVYRTKLLLSTNAKGPDHFSVSLRPTIPWGGIIKHGVIGAVVGGGLLGIIRFLVAEGGNTDWLVNLPYPQYSNFLNLGMLKVGVIGGGIIGWILDAAFNSD